MPRREIITGFELYYEDTGEVVGHDASAPLVFHHAYTASRDSWAEVVSRLRSRRRCVVRRK